MAKIKGKMGSSFDSFLAEQGTLEECEEQAIKQILADQDQGCDGEGPSHEIGHGGTDADEPPRAGPAP